jgi:hypothetical protein
VPSRRLLALFAFAPAIVLAQSPLKVAPSGRATTEVALSGPREEGKPAAKALVIKVDFGQPHVRGRDVPVELSKVGTVWRTGANTATSLTSDVDLTIGSATVPKGAYSLYTIRTADGYLLIINRQTGQSGMDYDVAKDLARVPLTARALTEVRESLQIALVPAGDGAPRGLLTIAWGKLELSTNWSAR